MEHGYCTGTLSDYKGLIHGHQNKYYDRIE
jgi:hypothetical protein